MSGCKENKSKMTRKSISLDIKMQVLRRLENGERQVDIGNALNLSTSTIRTIVKNKDKIKLSATTTTSSNAAKITRSRSNILEEMEKRLCIWIDDEIERNMPLSQKIIMQKALSIFNHIENEREDTSENFTASRGWFDNFKKRSNLHNIRITGEAASADTVAASNFPATLKAIIERGNYPPELVFNVDETGLFWKRMPKRTFISREEKRAPGFKAAKDRFTILLGGNANGDLKLKPLLVYHAKTPRAMKGVIKSSLPIIWEFNKKSWITRDIFQNWFTTHFCPYVKRYCDLNNFEPKALLLLDNAPSHPVNLSELITCIPVEIVFLPPNTTSLIQPMDQGAIANFKAHYLRRTFQQLIDKTEGGSKQTILQFWKKYNILDAVGNIDVAWQALTKKCMNGVWKKIWPEVSQDYQREETIVGQIVNLVEAAGIGDVDEQDIEELLQVSGEGLTNEDLKELANQEIEENESSDSEDDEPKEIKTDFLKKSLETITETVDQLVANDPNFDRSSKARRGVLDAIACYRHLLNERKRKRQMTLDDFFAKKSTILEEPGPSSQI